MQFYTLIKSVRCKRKGSSCFLSLKAASTSRSTSNSRVSLKSSAHRRGVRSITQEQQWQRINCFTWRAFPTIWPSLLHQRGRNGKVLPTLSKWIQNCVRDGLCYRELEDLELQELHKGQQRWKKDRKKIKKCITKYIKCMFYGSLTVSIFFLSGSIKVTLW